MTDYCKVTPEDDVHKSIKELKEENERLRSENEDKSQKLKDKETEIEKSN